MDVQLPPEFWIVVTQLDMSAGHPDARGPLVHESYCLSREDAESRAKILGRYGWVKIIRVAPASTVVNTIIGD